MPNQPLHVKYRPKNFEQFLGNETVIESLKSVLYNEKIRPHTFLFTGPSGCGKTTLARILKIELECSDRDFIEMNTANTRGIDSIRDIISNCGYAPFEGKVKVYLFDEAGKLTNDAQNALLKILEDTPNHVYFILSTTDPEKLLKTIRTRCSTYQLRSLQRRKIIKLLRTVCESEDIDISVDIFKEIARVSEGSPRQALVVLSQIIGIEDKEEIIKIIEEGSIKESQVKEICQLLMERKKGKWKEMSELLKGIEAEPETVRYAVLRYLNTVLLNRGEDNVAEMIELFSESFMYSGKAGLSASCYLACKI